MLNRRSMRILCLLWFVLCALFGHSQPFQTDSPDQNVEVPLHLATEVWVYFENLSQDTLQLRWRRMQEELPNAWNVDICDYGSCYTGVPASAYMNPAPPGTSPFLKLIVQPDDLEGEGFYWFRIYNAADESQYLDISIAMTTPGMVSSVHKLTLRPIISAYPNPAHDKIQIRVDDSQLHDAWIFSASGQLFWQGRLSSVAAEIETASWAPGMYFLSSTSGNQHFIIQH